MPSGSAGGVFHCVAALLCAHHLPGQGPHAPRSHQWPDIHVHSQGRSWREGCPPLYPTFSQDGRKLLCTHEVGGTPSGCGRGVDYLRALGHVLSRAVPEPCEFWGVESFIHALSSLLPLDRLPPSPVWPPGSQSHPKPSSQPADSAVHHECHLIISLATSRHPFFYRGECTLSRLFRDPSRAHSLPRHPTASTHQWGGALLPWGQDKFFGKSGPWKQSDCGSTAPQKSTAIAFQMAPRGPAGTQPRRRPAPGRTTSTSGAPDPCSAWSMDRGLESF